jgi:2,3-bisphosphoglycerate-dependent phosphoglycerate mutase
LPTTTLHLIRHAEAYANVDPTGPVAGMKGDRGLTELGRQQAAKLRDRLVTSGELTPDAFLSSPLPRARETAEIIQPAFGLDIEIEPDLEEVRVGEADGEPILAVIKRYGLPGFRRQPFKPISPGGEYWAQFVLRVGTTLNRLASMHEGKTLVMLTHGGFIDASLIAHFSAGVLVPPPRLEFDTLNTSITTWVRHGEDTHWHWRLGLYNDYAHVRGMVVDHRQMWEEAFTQLQVTQTES